MGKDSYNNKIAFASFIAAISVVVIHIGVEAPRGTLTWWIHQMTANGLCRWAVPFFFATAGYFLSKHIEEPGWWKTAVKQRLRTIVIPYLSWNIVYFLFFTALCVSANFIACRPWNTNMLTGWDCLMWIGLHPLKGAYNCTLWFLPTLFLFVVASPVYVWLVRRFGWLAPTLLFCLSYVGIPSMPFNFNPGWMMWFVGGIAARIRPLHVTKIWGGGIVLGLSYVAWDKYVRFCAGCTEHWDSTPLPAIVLIVVGIWAIMPSVVLPRSLLRATFPIYLLHVYMLTILSLALPGLPERFHVIVFLPLALLGCLVCEALLHRYVPRLAALVFGGR